MHVHVVERTTTRTRASPNSYRSPAGSCRSTVLYDSLANKNPHGESRQLGSEFYDVD